MVHRIVFSIFFVWLFKVPLLRVGGQDAYNRLRPAFIGIAAGYALGVMITFVVDLVFFPGDGYSIHG
jgi:hypothetical protein